MPTRSALRLLSALVTPYTDKKASVQRSINLLCVHTRQTHSAAPGLVEICLLVASGPTFSSSRGRLLQEGVVGILRCALFAVTSMRAVDLRQSALRPHARGIMRVLASVLRSPLVSDDCRAAAVKSLRYIGQMLNGNFEMMPDTDAFAGQNFAVRGLDAIALRLVDISIAGSVTHPSCTGTFRHIMGWRVDAAPVFQKTEGGSSMFLSRRRGTGLFHITDSKDTINAAQRPFLESASTPDPVAGELSFSCDDNGLPCIPCKVWSGNEWIVQDVVSVSHSARCCADVLEECKRICIAEKCGAFVTYEDMAYFRQQSRQQCKSSACRVHGAVLHLAPTSKASWHTEATRWAPAFGKEKSTPKLGMRLYYSYYLRETGYLRGCFAEC